MNILVCPSDNATTLTLSEFTFNSICYESVSNCDKLQSAFTKIYSPFVIIVGKTEFIETSRLISTLSLCGVGTVIVNTLLQSSTNLCAICPKDKNVIVFNTDKEILDSIRVIVSATVY